ncbi:MAG: response regulator transcription factor [Tissierella sp.]|nr:response regulator transcription factor [Tissierella sp.]
MKYKILLVDDEKDIVKLLQDYFEIQDYMVYAAYSGKEALDKLELKPDLILLDINMPGMDGMELCKRIRNFVNCPIVFLTARIEEQDRINGLMIGGDDYIIKPFSLDELGARVLAHLRREERRTVKEEIKFCGGIVIQYSERRVFVANDEVNLTKTEFDIIEFLSLNKGRVFSKEQIYERLWGIDKDGDSNIITEHIRRVRSKLGAYYDGVVIETVWGVGYKWIG